VVTPARIIVEVKPVGGHGRFVVKIGGRVLVRSSREPFCAAARALLAEGADGASILVMRHVSSEVDALRGPIGVAAGLTVREDNGPPELRPYRVPLSRMQAPRTATEGEEAA
jgi:hypothetical protein